MPFVKVRIPRTSQPQDACGIDLDNPLALGFVACEFANGRVISQSPNYQNSFLISGVGEPGKNVDASSSGQVQSVVTGRANADATLLCLVDGGYPQECIALEFGGDGSGYAGSTRGLRVFNGKPSAYTRDMVVLDGLLSVPTTHPYTIAATFKESETRLFLNGSLDVAGFTLVGASGKGEVSFGDINSAHTPRPSPWHFKGRRYISLCFNTAKSDAEVKSLSDNPWQIFEPEEITIWVPTVSSSDVLLGADAAGQASASATLLHGVNLAGAALSVASSSASMSHSVPLAAAATGTASSTGQVKLSIRFAAGALAQALATGQAAVGKPLAAAGAGQVTGGAALNVAAAGGAVNLAAAGAAQATGTATLALAVNFSAVALAQAASSAAFGGAATLATQAIANAQASAALSVGKPIAAAGQGQASGSAMLWLDIPLGADALVQASAGGALSLSVTLEASALAQASSGASFPAAISLQANGSAVATGSASLRVTNSNTYGPSIFNAWVSMAVRRAYVPLAQNKVRVPVASRNTRLAYQG